MSLNLNVSIDPNFFDPDIIDVVSLFFATYAKYAFLFGSLMFLANMVLRAASGKEKFL